MNSPACYAKKLHRLCSTSCHFTKFFIFRCYRYLLLTFNPFSAHVLYFLSLSVLGFGILKSLNPRTSQLSPRNIDLFFTSVSAATVSGMSTVEMEVFSNSQLILMTVVMFIGGEVFTSMVGLHLKRSKMKETMWKSEGTAESADSNHTSPPPQTESGTADVPESGLTRLESRPVVSYPYRRPNLIIKYDSVRFLGFVVLGYILAIHILGISSVLIYLGLVSGAENVLKRKGLNTFTFAFFTVVSSFASCGLVPTNENMIVFSRNSGLLWILIPQVLFGNTLFPPCLRLVVWVLGEKIINKAEADHLLDNTSEAAGYVHFLPGPVHCVFLVATVVGFVLIGFVLFCSMEWDSVGLSGLGSYQKVVGVIFQCVNARHAGENIVDLSTIAPAVLVFFVVMMYLPPYTTFLPIKKRDGQVPVESQLGNTVAENLIFSKLSYLVIFIILICITERKSMYEDPLNFSLLNIVVEVISAYGNVGFTTGYHCESRIKPDSNCATKWYGFSGKWSDEGKIILIIVMFFGRLKKFNMIGGRASKQLL